MNDTQKQQTPEDHANRHYTEVIRNALRSYVYLKKSQTLECEEIEDAFFKLTGYHIDPRED